MLASPQSVLKKNILLKCRLVNTDVQNILMKFMYLQVVSTFETSHLLTPLCKSLRIKCRAGRVINLAKSKFKFQDN